MDVDNSDTHLLSTRNQSRKRSIGGSDDQEQKEGAPRSKRIRNGGAAITTQGKFPATAGVPREELTNAERTEFNTTGKRRSCYPKELAVDRNLIRISMSPDEPERPKQPSTSDSQLHVEDSSSSNDKNQMLPIARSKKDPTPAFSEIQQTAAETTTTPTNSANPKKQPLLSKAAGDAASDHALDDKERSQHPSSSAGPWNIPPRKMTRFWRLSTAVIVVLVGIAVAAPAFQAPTVKSSQQTARSRAAAAGT